ncbi:methyl-accepting chemotaxis protein [Oceanirhabdus seepicola]|uniref:Methyl-accepting chemotaxis protein n=1 Tax=Oceanirhabdus seepicola TaxID=2828781 RepID=A0A9J6P4C6_9CLOT|nr:methyl-accepting chemotaxis protein [Oceanirhabdus seepicola]MCM1991419.1 methyl-accepting chemotaxis protein [Oceanirhabdus seepicola]
MKLKYKLIALFISFAIIPTITVGTLVYVQSSKLTLNSSYENLENQQKAAEISIVQAIEFIQKEGYQVAHEGIINKLFEVYDPVINTPNGKVNQVNNTEKKLNDKVLLNNNLPSVQQGNYQNFTEMFKYKLESMFHESKYHEEIMILDKNGKVIMTANGQGDNEEFGNADYFINIKENKVTYKSNAQKYSFSGNPVIYIAEPIMSKENQFLGAYVQVINLEKLSQEYIENIKIGSEGYVYIAEKDGTIIASPNKKQILQKDNMVQINESNISFTDKLGTSSYTYENIKYESVYTYNENLGWVITASIPTSETKAVGNLITKILALSTILIAVAACITSVIIARRISTPLEKISTKMEKVAEGDFTIKIEEGSNDEIGIMSKGINSTLNKIKESIGKVKNTSKSVANSSDTLKCTSDQMVQTSEEVANSIQEVAKGAYSQAEELMEIVNLISNFDEEIKKVEHQIINVTENSKDTEDKAQNGTHKINELIVSINNIKEKFDITMVKINDLSLAISQIEKITDTINDISEQTNMLALNAAIEAARAGENGKGFSVVAEEVRKLAEESKKSSERIMSLIKAIIEDTKKVNENTNSVNELMEEQQSVAEISMTAFKDILSSVNKIPQSMKETSSSVNQVVEIKDVILNKVENVTSVAQEVSASAEQISASSEEMLASTEEVLRMAENVQGDSMDLQEKMNIFKIDEAVEN